MECDYGSAWQHYRGIVLPSVGLNSNLTFDDKMAKRSGGKIMDTREIIVRDFERRFFCHFIFLPFSWLSAWGGMAVLGISFLSIE
jgi:hypothetical protein